MPLGYLCCSCCRGVHILEKKKVMCVSCCIGCVEEQQFHFSIFLLKGLSVTIHVCQDILKYVLLKCCMFLDLKYQTTCLMTSFKPIVTN